MSTIAIILGVIGWLLAGLFYVRQLPIKTKEKIVSAVINKKATIVDMGEPLNLDE